MQMGRRRVSRLDHGVKTLDGDGTASETERSLRLLEKRNEDEGRPLHLQSLV